jgi:hypothetical protein
MIFTILPTSVDDWKFRVNDEGVIQTFVPHPIGLTNRNTNEKVMREGWMNIYDVGNLWIEFEISYPDEPHLKKYLGGSHSLETSTTYLNLQSTIN